jgi:RimJ/RimL family protein N-acetyltransferase
MNRDLLRGELTRLVAQDPEADAEAMAKWSRDSEYLRLLDSEAVQPALAKQFKTEIEQRASRVSSYPFTIRALADDRPVGFIGLSVNWPHGEAYVGIGIGDRQDWGKGYGTDAMRVLLRYAFTELNLHRVSLGVLEYNPRALRSYEKAGFVLEGRTRQDVLRDGRHWDSLWMGLLRPEWEAQQTAHSG